MCSLIMTEERKSLQISSVTWKKDQAYFILPQKAKGSLVNVGSPGSEIPILVACC